MTEKIERLLEAKFQEPEFLDCYVVEIVQNRNRLEVFFDCDSGVTFEKCKDLSRYLESHLDENEWLGENYVLEVSSPGVDRPLKLHRQYRKNISRKVEVKLMDGQSTEGKLTEVHDSYIIIEAKVKQEGEKKAVLQPVEIPFEKIEKTLVKVSW